MNEDQQKDLAMGFLKGRAQQKFYLYSYIFMIVIALLDILLAGIGMIVDLEKGLNYVWYYLAIGSGLVSLLLLAWLSALYFVGADEAPSSARIKCVSVIRVLIRLFNVLNGVFFLVLSIVYKDSQSNGWNGFMKGYGIVIIVIEAIMFVYALWKNAWIKENPGRYVSPTYPVYPSEGAKEETKVSSKKEERKVEHTEIRPAIENKEEPAMIEVKSTPKKKASKKEKNK
ncbi:MAG: hypothetical protein LKF75_02065 [Bacilli bacterium]|jgi:disulfide bond formation protein DsbB|nr:hypothetical protein [Bacilli bacterium]MCH4211172.1 hypothetical protein [Bacilli bacterium]MCH4228476.1 hypothetical protein [Bacilli bacterium]MCH4277590.1 hypothetical protein [Bacilli bacterium]MCI2054929.1 hypothetical protein [Bacilli bacterium]